MKFLCLLYFAIASSSALVLVDSTLASACVYYEKGFDWGCGTHSNGMKAYTCRCGNVNWLGTITNCINSNSKSRHVVDHAFKHIAGRCLSRGNFHYSLDDMWKFYENGTRYLRNPTKNDEESEVFTTLLVNQTDFDWYYSKFKGFTFEVERSQWFGWGLVFYWASIIAIASLFNISNRYIGFKLFSKSFRKHLAIPPLVRIGNTTSRYADLLLPDAFRTRLEVLIVGVFVCLSIISVGVGYELQTPHPYLTNRWFMNLVLVSYRVDLMSMSLFPVIYFFGIRNNPFIKISGLSYSTFNYFHKWCAYVCAILAFIHSIIWTTYSIKEGGYKMWWNDAYWKWGIAAMTLLGLLVFHAAKLIRDIAYEVFLFLHRFMNIFFIICMYYHCISLGWLGWIWSMAGILGFEYMMRIIRIMLSGGFQKAELTYCGDSVLKMTIRKPKFFKYGCGSFSFIYFVDFHDPWYYPWQSHPFTLLSTPESVDEKLIVYFRAKKGMTNHLLKKIFSSGECTISHRIIIEGPYGNNVSVAHPNNKVVGIAAGLGVTAVYAYFSKIAKNKQSTIVNKFIWIIRNRDHISWFRKELEWLKSKDCEIAIVTTSQISIEDSFITFNDKESTEEFCFRDLGKRPDLVQIISNEITAACEERNDLTFVACGPSSFNRELRAAISQKTCNSLSIAVDYKEESFTW